jgi:hypothetical protein
MKRILWLFVVTIAVLSGSAQPQHTGKHFSREFPEST